MLIRGRGRKISHELCARLTVPEFTVGKLATMQLPLNEGYRNSAPVAVPGYCKSQWAAQLRVEPHLASLSQASISAARRRGSSSARLSHTLPFLHQAAAKFNTRSSGKSMALQSNIRTQQHYSNVYRAIIQVYSRKSGTAAVVAVAVPTPLNNIFSFSILVFQ